MPFVAFTPMNIRGINVEEHFWFKYSNVSIIACNFFSRKFPCGARAMRIPFELAGNMYVRPFANNYFRNGTFYKLQNYLSFVKILFTVDQLPNFCFLGNLMTFKQKTIFWYFNSEFNQHWMQNILSSIPFYSKYQIK